MTIDIQSLSLQEQFEEIIREDNKLRIQDFLNSQNISDVADLIRDNEDYAAQIRNF
jgi:magnesium transporter